MKKFLMILCAVMLVFGMVGTASAIPVEFSETFLGSQYSHNTDPHFTLWEGYKARFKFNLTDTGGYARLLNDSNGLEAQVLPTEDETGYDPALFLDPFEASLNFQFSSRDLVPETVRIRAAYYDGATLLAEEEYDLGYWSRDSLSRVRQYTTLSIDLGSAGVLPYLADGKFVSLVLAPDVYDCWDNDFSIEWANLTAKADPVPEPSTILLLGLGLIGMAGYGRKRFSKKG